MKTAHQNVPTPQQDQDVANKKYVDDSSGGITGVEVDHQPPAPNGPAPSMQFQALGIKPDGSVVHVGSLGGPEAWRFSTATNKWITTAPAAIPLNSVRQFVFNATGTKMYVILASDPTAIHIVDTATNTITGTVSGFPVLFGINTMAIQPGTNELWAHYDAGPNWVGRVDTTTDSLITSFTAATGNGYSMVFNPAGTKMYYVGADTLGFGVRLHIYDATTYTLITSLSDTPLYRYLVALPDGTEIWATRDGVFPAPDEVIRVSTATDSIVGAPMLSSQANSSGPYVLCAKSDSSKVYALLASGDIDVITVAGHSVTNTIAMSGSYAGDLIINPASTKLYASNPQLAPYWVKEVTLATETVTDQIDASDVVLPAPVVVGTFDALRITGAKISDDGGGQGSIELPVVFDASPTAYFNIKANRPFPSNSIVDQTKTGVTNFGVGSTASADNATVGGGTGNLASGISSAVPGGNGNVASGEASVAMGFGSTASAEGSMACNVGTAGGNYSSAFNYATVSAGAEASVAFADGGVGLNSYGCTALNGSSVDNDCNYCHAEGTAFIDNNSNQCHAEGRNTYIGQNVNYSHVEGNGCGVEADNAHAEGDGSAVAVGAYGAHAEGGGCTASGPDSHAEGVASDATGYYAHAQNGATTAQGEGSHSEGDGTFAEGNWSHSQGSVSHAFRETQFSHGGGQSGGFGSGLGVSQTSWLQFRSFGSVTGPGASSDLRYGVLSGGSAVLPLQDLRAYTFRVTVVVNGRVAGPVYKTRTFKLQFNARCIAGVATLVASGASEEFGDAATWTIVPSVASNNVILTFNTGADTHTCYVAAHVEFVEVRFNA